MYTLYYAPGTASFAVHWMLIELGVPFEARAVDFATRQQKDPEYLRLNPSGMVPALIVDGTARAECAALLTLLAERHPEAGFAPAVGTAERAVWLQWMFTLANTLQPLFRGYFYADEPAGPGREDVVKAAATPRIEKVWERVDAQLGTSGGHLAGPDLSTADFLVTMLMRWSRNMPRPATDWPHIAAYVKRMTALPSFKEVNAREKLERDPWPR